jgi:hypothetical protein
VEGKRERKIERERERFARPSNESINVYLQYSMRAWRHSCRKLIQPAVCEEAETHYLDLGSGEIGSELLAWHARMSVHFNKCALLFVV